MSDDTLFPFEIVIEGTPISHQAKTAASKDAWKQRVNSAARDRQELTYQLGFLDDREVAVTIYYFTSEPMEGDIDNIVKPILDALIAVAYLDDKVVERVVVQKFEPGTNAVFSSPTAQLAKALDLQPPVVYIRVDDDLGWRAIN